MALDLITTHHLSVQHGFSTRAGGVSEGFYSSLNLGLSTGDDPEKVAQNRQRFLTAFGVQQAQVSGFGQVHGSDVLIARSCWFEEEADAMISNDPELLLVVSAADCFPLLFHDPVQGAIAAAHAGWRGTVKGIAAKVVKRLGEVYASDPRDIRVVIGPGISQKHYQVSAEVIAEVDKTAVTEQVYRPDGERYRLDLAALNRWMLETSGVLPENIHSTHLCTHDDPEQFFSHRRDQGKTGRHWAAIRLQSAS